MDTRRVTEKVTCPKLIAEYDWIGEGVRLCGCMYIRTYK